MRMIENTRVRYDYQGFVVVIIVILHTPYKCMTRLELREIIRVFFR